ncbi:galactinol--sucrose galactosyltransferase [Salvia divinorum]|uniref:Galactinol--sucrose galactosyltransferase n=1 Tax=Salvia divinorum TaxID=28513 RepID=A0ABD1GQ85_SALDI
MEHEVATTAKTAMMKSAARIEDNKKEANRVSSAPILDLCSGESASARAGGLKYSHRKARSLFPNLGCFLPARFDFAHNHIAAGAISGGPVYVRDATGKHNFDLLRKLILPDAPSSAPAFMTVRQQQRLPHVYNCRQISILKTAYHKHEIWYL